MKKMIILVAVFTAFVLQADGLVADKKEHDLICGIQPYKHPRWMSEIELTNGKKLHFVSVKCMMLFYYKNSKWHDLGYDKRPTKEDDFIKELRVQDYKSLKVLNNGCIKFAISQTGKGNKNFEINNLRRFSHVKTSSPSWWKRLGNSIARRC